MNNNYLLGYNPHKDNEPIYNYYDADKRLWYRLIGESREYEPMCTTTQGIVPRSQLEPAKTIKTMIYKGEY